MAEYIKLLRGSAGTPPLSRQGEAQSACPPLMARLARLRQGSAMSNDLFSNPHESRAQECANKDLQTTLWFNEIPKYSRSLPLPQVHHRHPPGKRP